MGLVAIPLLGAMLSVGYGLLDSGRGETVRTFNADIRPILEAKCAPCHQPNSSGPFPLVTYTDVRRRSSLVWEKSLTRDMPPCYAMSDFGEFCWSTPISDDEAVIIQEWVRQGMVEGPHASGTADFSQTFRLSDYDVSAVSPNVDIPDFRIPYWQAVVVELPDGAPRNLAAFDIVPKTPEAFRSAVVGYISRERLDGRKIWETTGDLSAHVDGLIGGWGHAYLHWQLPDAYRLELPEDSVLVVQVQYQPTGKPEDGGFEIRLKGASPRAKKARYIQMGVEVFVAPQNRYLELWDDYVLERDASILGVIPEARLYAVAAHLKIDGPGVQGDYYRTVRWDPYWLGNYQVREPVRVRAGTRLEAYFAYDNMPHGPLNEDRDPVPVYSGTSLEEEVFRMFVLVSDE